MSERSSFHLQSQMIVPLSRAKLDFLKYFSNIASSCAALSLLKTFSPSVSVDTPSPGFPPRSQPVLPQPPSPAPLPLPVPFVCNWFSSSCFRICLVHLPLLLSASSHRGHVCMQPELGAELGCLHCLMLPPRRGCLSSLIHTHTPHTHTSRHLPDFSTEIFTF